LVLQRELKFENSLLRLEAKVAELLVAGVIAIPSLSWDPESSDARERDAIRRIGTIFGAYQVHTWYWELSEMLRKFLMVGLLIFVSPGEPAQLGCAMLITLFFLCIHLILQPFSTRDLNNMQAVSQASLTLTLFVGLIMIIDGYIEKEAALAQSGRWGQAVRNTLQELNHFIFSTMAVTVNLTTMVVPPLLMMKNLRASLPTPAAVLLIISSKIRWVRWSIYILYLRLKVFVVKDKESAKDQLFIARHDRDGSGQVDLHEFLGMEIHEGMSKKKLKQVFRSLDTDDSGTLDYSEFAKYRATLEVRTLGAAAASGIIEGWQGKPKLVKPGSVAKPRAFAQPFLIRPTAPEPAASEQDVAKDAGSIGDDASSDKSAAKTPDVQDDVGNVETQGPPSGDFRQLMLKGTHSIRKASKTDVQEDHPELLSPLAQSRLRFLVDSSKAYNVDSEPLLLQPPPRQVSAAPEITKITARISSSSQSSGSESGAEPRLLRRHPSAFVVGQVGDFSSCSPHPLSATTLVPLHSCPRLLPPCLALPSRGEYSTHPTFFC